MILPGVRYELTNLDLLGYEWDSDTDTVTPAEAENSYGHLFSMVHLRYIVAPRTNLRAAVTRTLARPNFFELVPYRFRDDEDLEIGNPNLKPTTAQGRSRPVCRSPSALRISSNKDGRRKRLPDTSGKRSRESVT